MRQIKMYFCIIIQSFVSASWTCIIIITFALYKTFLYYLIIFYAAISTVLECKGIDSYLECLLLTIITGGR